MTRAMLLCAGMGSRLGALGAAIPKPLLPVCDRPILEYGIANLVAHGITELVINLHHRGDLIEQTLGNGQQLGAHIQYTHEETLLGTGGGLKHALSLLDPHGTDEPFVSLNGKLIFDVDLTALLDAHSRAGDVMGTMVVREVADATTWGAVDVRPTGPHGSPQIHNILGPGAHMFCGVHVTRPSVVASLPNGEACMIRQGYLPWLHGGEQLAAYVHTTGYFAEHSNPERYWQSNMDLLAEPTMLRHPPGLMAVVDATARVSSSAIVIAPVQVGPGAVVEAGACIGPGVVVGRGATVAADAKLTGVVVWPGATAAGTLADCIVAPDGVVHVGRGNN